MTRPETTTDGLPFALTAVDRELLSQKDDDFKPHSWTELESIIETNDLSALKRKPSDLSRYIKWTADMKKQYGSITAFILANRLPGTWGQPPLSPRSQIPLDDAADYKVLLNDWPYGLEAGISHLVVWSRTPIPTDPETGDVTSKSRALIQDFVDRRFVNSLGPGRVLWFKNWVTLQSVRSLEHFHVLVRGADEDLLAQWVG
ncbi:hypothetical protein CDD80_1093 [Ophiocordyceps camponoti-rufipedis]|uniref:N-acetylglucosamine-induced protein 1 n=1 Tax=Ophiocordyceps camponoti-rufipedis TaxID=2004952 RepID=A0A2C5XMS6_9HYPO|nr:hypothetical protein CDD80_1093 [Ophiocordyceps camponoti-rufipedis]